MGRSTHNKTKAKLRWITSEQERNSNMKTFSKITLAAAVLAIASVAGADEVTDWNHTFLHAALIAGASPPAQDRAGAILQSAVFDALNGIERRYEPIHVPANAPRGASRRAAVAEAAYTILVDLYPAQKADFDAQLTASLAALTDGDGDADDESVLRGVAWGQAVAQAIWTWRSTDGFTPAPPPFTGGTAVGEWRPTPLEFLPFGALQFATMTPFVLQSPSQFRPAGPPALTSHTYTADFNESKLMGSATSTTRTADQTLLAEFWNASNPSYFWNAVAVNLGAERHTTMSENARLLALVNLALVDARIACWDAKKAYLFWRPITAITLADTDGNPLTVQDAAWTPLLDTPNHPDYPSGHSSVSSAAVTVLAHFFGEHTSFTVDSDVMTGVTRSFSSFSAASSEVNDARVFGGIHFRTAVNDGRALGKTVAHYILDHAVQTIHGHDGDRDHDDGHGHD
jgi:membrane-associated phospholipid phosphatase